MEWQKLTRESQIPKDGNWVMVCRYSPTSVKLLNDFSICDLDFVKFDNSDDSPVVGQLYIIKSGREYGQINYFDNIEGQFTHYCLIDLPPK